MSKITGNFTENVAQKLTFGKGSKLCSCIKSHKPVGCVRDIQSQQGGHHGWRRMRTETGKLMMKEKQVDLSRCFESHRVGTQLKFFT